MKTPRRALLLGILFAFSGAVSAAQAPVALDSARLRIPAIFAAYARNDAPGCMVGVFRAGTVLYTGAFGLADVAHRIPLSDTTVTAVASTSKQFTALSVLLLEAEGKLRLDDDIRLTSPKYTGSPAPSRSAPCSAIPRACATIGTSSTWRDGASRMTKPRRILWLIGRQRDLNHQTGAEFSTPTPATSFWPSPSNESPAYRSANSSPNATSAPSA